MISNCLEMKNERNGLPDHLKYLQMHCKTSLLKSKMSIRDKTVTLPIKTLLKNDYNSIEFFLMCFIFIDLLLLITHSAIQDIDIV